MKAKTKVIFFLLLLAGVGGKAKAEEMINVVAGGVVNTVPVEPPISTSAFRYKDWVEWLMLSCTKGMYGITCKVSDSQAEAIAASTNLTSWPIANQSEQSVPMLEASIAGALTGASAVIIVELLWKVLRYLEKRGEVARLLKHHSDSALGTMRSLPQDRYTTHLLEAICFPWLIEHSLLSTECIPFLARHLDTLGPMLNVVIGAVVGAGVAALNSSPKKVAMLLELTLPYTTEG